MLLIKRYVYKKQEPSHVCVRSNENVEFTIFELFTTRRKTKKHLFVNDNN